MGVTAGSRLTAGAETPGACGTGRPEVRPAWVRDCSRRGQGSSRPSVLGAGIFCRLAAGRRCMSVGGTAVRHFQVPLHKQFPIVRASWFHPGPPGGTSQASIASTNSGVTMISNSTSLTCSCTDRNAAAQVGQFELIQGSPVFAASMRLCTKPGDRQGLAGLEFDARFCAAIHQAGHLVPKS